MNKMSPFRPVTRGGSDVPAGALPLVLVVEPVAGLSLVLQELCAFLSIRVATARDASCLVQGLEARPIAVLVRAPAGVVDHGTGAALEAVARHDPAMPVMLVTDLAQAPADGGRAPMLTNMHWMGGPPSLKPLVEFLFLAERRQGVAGLMPVGNG